MTPKEQNEALAILGGWVQKRFTWESGTGLPCAGSFWVSAAGNVTCEAPDFVGAAKLLGKIEVVLTYEQKRAADRFVMDNDQALEIYSPYRTEAVLRVLGLWK